ncbi:MAG: chemotaxis response regulator protein-glutamate methylesterase [Verrucomicrobia bacterium]|nr:chemotaxis response regulator protein-glutamate methylesterase [Verrucomicrobiota bacterium]
MAGAAPKKIRTLVVDDSALARQMVARALRTDPSVEVVGTADDPYEARERILELHPDVVTLDVEMPRMDGITFLRILMKHHPMAVVIVSTFTQAGSAKALEALEAGAVEVLGKPANSVEIPEFEAQLLQKVKSAAAARLSRARKGEPAAVKPAPNGVADRRQVILLGASTGGTEALKEVLTRLPDGLPPICIVQHIPAYISKQFAERLNDLCAMEVREAQEGDVLLGGLALVAPGGYHMSLRRTMGHYQVRLDQTPPVNYQRPSVDVLFDSAASCVGRHAIAALLTGMGKDGATGMKKLREAGALTIAQDEETSVVFGMPRAAIELGAARYVYPLEDIAGGILNCLRKRKVAT